MEITGKLKVKGNNIKVSEKFTKREFVITTDEKYPQDILIQLTQQNVYIIDKYNVGENIKVQINLKGREWTSPQGEVKYFNTIEAGRIESVGSVAPETTAQSEQAYGNAEDNGNLPF
jgi:single-strand DNA-binding protein